MLLDVEKSFYCEGRLYFFQKNFATVRKAGKLGEKIGNFRYYLQKKDSNSGTISIACLLNPTANNAYPDK